MGCTSSKCCGGGSTSKQIYPEDTITEVSKFMDKNKGKGNTKNAPVRPLSGTLMRKASEDSGLHSQLSSLNVNGPCSVIWESPRNQDPNALNLTPEGQASRNHNPDFKSRKDKTEAVAMFIPFESPHPRRPRNRTGPRLSGSHKPQSDKSGRKIKSRFMESPATGKAAGESPVFIPGTGTEKMLMSRSASKASNPNKLQPLKFHRVEAHASVKDRIAADRKAKRTLVKATNKCLKECGFDRKIAKLIREFADISTSSVANNFECEIVTKENSPPKLPSTNLPVLNDPFQKRKLLL